MKPQPFILIFILFRLYHIQIDENTQIYTPRTQSNWNWRNFLFSDDPDSTKNWSERHLGIEVNE